MLLRRKISIVAAASVAIAVAIAILASYFIVRGKLIGQVDSELTTQAQNIVDHVPGALSSNTPLPGNSAESGGNAPYIEFVGAGPRDRLPRVGGMLLPTDGAIIAVAKGTTPTVLTTLTASDGTRLRIYAFHATYSPNGLTSYPIAVELARPLSQVDTVLSSLRLILALLFLVVVGLAALLARMATRRVMKPLAEVTATAQLIGETDDLSRRIAVHEADEVGQLATSFNEMLERLEISRGQLDASVIAQRQLVADASHELRTPVTSLRTNIEVLLSGMELEEEDRTRLLTDVVEQSEELSTLVSDLIEVARGDTAPKHIEDIRLDRLAEDALDRARRNTPQIRFDEHLQPMTVQGNPERLIRAINNLLDNAALHAGHGGPVEVTVDSTGVTVRDHGDGIAEADLPHVFDRFYRGANSRSRQGSGLGLAIVRQAAEQHGGSVSAANAVDGGAVFTLKLPTSPTAADPVAPGPTENSDRLWSDGSQTDEHHAVQRDAVQRDAVQRDAVQRDAGEHEAGGEPSAVPDDPSVPRDAEVSA
jgi:two-component system sensor histidine kinase MprB